MYKRSTKRSKAEHDASFTLSERTVKKYCVLDSLRAANVILTEMHDTRKKCKNFDPRDSGWVAVRMEALGSRNYYERLTLEEVNQLTDFLVNETLNYFYDLPPESEEPVDE